MRRTWMAVAALLCAAPAQANYYEIVDGEVTLAIGMPHFTAGVFDLADPDWSFANDPNWRTEIVPCPLVPYLMEAFSIWESHQAPVAVSEPVAPPVDVDPPPFGGPPPVETQPCLVGCGGSPPVVVAVPEASTWLMLLMGLAGLALVGRRKRSYVHVN